MRLAQRQPYEPVRILLLGYAPQILYHICFHRADEQVCCHLTFEGRPNGILGNRVKLIHCPACTLFSIHVHIGS